MRAEAQILTSLLNHTVLFALSSIPDEEETELVRQLVDDAQTMFIKVEWKDEDLQSLFQRWFRIGRECEWSNLAPLVPVPTDVKDSLKDVVAYQIDALFERIASDLEALCRLMWIWLQWGRAYEKGNVT